MSGTMSPSADLEWFEREAVDALPDLFGAALRLTRNRADADIMASFIENGGQIWACGACTKPRSITDAQLISGARIVTAAMVVEQRARARPPWRSRDWRSRDWRSRVPAR